MGGRKNLGSYKHISDSPVSGERVKKPSVKVGIEDPDTVPDDIADGVQRTISDTVRPLEGDASTSDFPAETQQRLLNLVGKAQECKARNRVEFYHFYRLMREEVDALSASKTPPFYARMSIWLSGRSLTWKGEQWTIGVIPPDELNGEAPMLPVKRLGLNEDSRRAVFKDRVPLLEALCGIDV